MGLSVVRHVEEQVVTSTMLEKDMNSLEEKLAYYLSLPYTIEVIKDSESDAESWFALVAELPGCMTEADNFTELGEMIHDAMVSWLETALEDGQAIPEPRPVESYSGKFVLRLPKSLHRTLTKRAEQEGVSLNAFINVALGQAVSLSPLRVDSKASVKKTPPPICPQLSDTAWQAMIAAGVQVEAQTVNETLFAHWLEQNIQQIEAAIATGSITEAEHYLTQSCQALKIVGADSPLMQVFCQTLRLLEQQILAKTTRQTAIVT